MRDSAVHGSLELGWGSALPLPDYGLGWFLHGCKKHRQSDDESRTVQDTEDGEMNFTEAAWRLQGSHSLVGVKDMRNSLSVQCDGGV